MRFGPAALPLIAAVLMGADDPWAEASTQDLHGYARAVSLDIRGVVPTAAELTAVETAGELDDATLDAWLSSEAFTETAVDRHKERFWNELEINLLNNRRISRRDGIYFLPSRARSLRGQPQVHCGTAEADVDGDNRPLSWQDNGDGTISEGWVWVDPYWDPGVPVKVCAFDAQTVAVSESGTDCATEPARTDDLCGCGPDLQWCLTGSVESQIEVAISADIDHRVRAMIASDAPYSTLFTGPFMYMNGASAHFYRHLAVFRTDDYASPVPDASIPDLDFNDEAFVTVALPEHHAGTLTSPAWLLRHQTNRGRANRFYGGFLCSEFLPVSSDTSALASTELPSPDLQRREGCLDCHARLEPWSAYWGRWAQAGARFLPADTYPAFSDTCAECETGGGSCPDICEDHYVTTAGHPDEDPFVGSLRAYAFLAEDKAHHPDDGPGAWVERSISDGSLAACAVSTASSWLLGNTPAAEDATAWAEAFAADEDYRALVRRVVTSRSYWGGAQ